MKTNSLKELIKIPGVGKSIAQDLFEIGITKISDLNNNLPEKLYSKLCKQKKAKIDKCVLYVFRCAVYFASNKKHDEKLLKWWNWRDAK
ncbi:helix-hairpin-helix domain-containing protein [bacterium]